jgi:outer membrane protein
MKSKYRLLIMTIGLLIGATMVFAAETIPKIGVINRKKVTQTYFKDSKTLRDLEAEKEKAEEYIKNQMDEIKALDVKKIEADKKDDSDTSMKLAADIKKKEDYIREYNRVTTQQYNDKLQKLYYSDNFMKELLQAVERVSQKEGMSIVLDITKSDILYYAEDLDITDKVIEELLHTR